MLNNFLWLLALDCAAICEALWKSEQFIALFCFPTASQMAAQSTQTQEYWFYDIYANYEKFILIR